MHRHSFGEETLTESNSNTQTMIKFLSFDKIFLFLGLIIFGCGSNNKKEKKFDFRKEVWIYDSQTMPDSIRNFTDNFLIFDSTNVYMNNENIGEYNILNDTLRIFQTSYILQKGGKYNKKVSDQFMGVVIKMDTNQILLKVIRGYFPLKSKMSSGKFDESKIIKLTNQKCKKKKHINFGYISIASSFCFGTCPDYNLELYKDGFIKFHCSSYCKKIGYYEGKLTNNDLKKVVDFISYLKLKNDSTIFSRNIDAPEAVVKLKVNKREYYFYGCPSEFQNKLQELMNELLTMAEKSKLNKTKSKLKFKANFIILPPVETIQFLPPIIEK